MKFFGSILLILSSAAIGMRAAAALRQRAVRLRLMRQLQITLLVTKESGRAGGFPEKLAAARRLGVRVLVIRRPTETGMGKEELMGAIHDYNTNRNRLRP